MFLEQYNLRIDYKKSLNLLNELNTAKNNNQSIVVETIYGLTNSIINLNNFNISFKSADNKSFMIHFHNNIYINNDYLFQTNAITKINYFDTEDSAKLFIQMHHI